MDGLDAAAPQADVRAQHGRWAPGQSGNPAGKKPGTRNRASLLRELLDDGDVSVAIRVLRDRLDAGDGVAARFVLDRLFPKPRDREIDLGLPPPEAGTTVADMLERILWLAASGEITLDEATRMTRLIERRIEADGRAARAAAARERLAAHDRPDAPATGSKTASPASDLQTADAAAPKPAAAAPMNRHDRRRAAALLRAALAPVAGPPPRTTAA